MHHAHATELINSGASIEAHPPPADAAARQQADGWTCHGVRALYLSDRAQLFQGFWAGVLAQEVGMGVDRLDHASVEWHEDR
ncbi:hypothetical protein AB0B45_50065 [Nonomuraea sp. NPDC049152]|uniref:hypothetical protein n=1 Tax=Nonomuraea sp. NPDC049152 TaxID=3154350 RepID=UPI0033E6E297